MQRQDILLPLPVFIFVFFYESPVWIDWLTRGNVAARVFEKSAIFFMLLARKGLRVQSSSSSSEEVGKLGKWLNDCVKTLHALCGGTLEIGPMLATLNGQNADANSCDAGKISSSSDGNDSPSQTSSYSSQTSPPLPDHPTNVPVTGAAANLTPLGFAAVVMLIDSSCGL
ncbi:hypothetical protein LEL_07640 [Akanthomyces lecanii RCEF 1005]|uniref:Uncharacterized protein n=1 Tax=Akanthomyces lecanii RCEF 1005 TaxID=1081108 RepID=A0A162JZ95_CORDF|nr:hypothetical protein LEL_07640 [Akanthomyces lecanii RCEF 1005]